MAGVLSTKFAGIARRARASGRSRTKFAPPHHFAAPRIFQEGNLVPGPTPHGLRSSLMTFLAPKQETAQRADPPVRRDRSINT
jgi:hypothetical protein